MPRIPKPPAYRCRIIRRKRVAYMTLMDAVTKKRRDFWLGPYGTQESRERYARLIADWEAAGRVLAPRHPTAGGPTIAQICLAYWNAIQGHYSKSELQATASAIRMLRQYFGSAPATTFGPKNLRLLRDQMVRGDLGASPPRAPWSRPSINRQIHRVRGIFKWAVAQEIIPVTVYEALRTLAPLRRGQTTAREPEPVRPVSEEHVAAARPFLSRQVAAMIDLQLLTGMRPGEVCLLRPCDLDTSGKVWLYCLTQHKTAHFGHSRVVYFGPRAQMVLQPFLLRPPDSYCFSPAEADAKRRAALHAERKTPLAYGNRPGTNRKAEPKRVPGERYTTGSYRRAIDRACRQAGVPSWHPHQLRHNYATNVRREHGLEAAQLLLGHSSAVITDAVYAERDEKKAMGVALQMG